MLWSGHERPGWAVTRRQDLGPEQHEVDDALQHVAPPLVKVTMLTASVRMRSELDVFDGVRRQSIADNQKLK
jgi:hypothetical protein